MPASSPRPEEESLRLLGHELQTALAALSGHAQLLHRQLRREPPSHLEQYLARLEAMTELVLRASGLVALLQTGTWRDFRAEADPAAGPDDQASATVRSA